MKLRPTFLAPIIGLSACSEIEQVKVVNSLDIARIETISLDLEETGISRDKIGSLIVRDKVEAWIEHLEDKSRTIRNPLKISILN